MKKRDKYEKEFNDEQEDFGGAYKPSRDPFLREELIDRNIRRDENYCDKKRAEEDLWDKPLGGGLKD